MAGLDRSGVTDRLRLTVQPSFQSTVSKCFITARIDYCNSLLAGCGQQQIDKLQCVMNCAARVIYNCHRRDHVMSLLRDNLHWLCIQERILFKLCLMVYKDLSGLGPSYITELCVPVDSISSRSALRSAANGTLFVPRTRLELGKRAFVVADSDILVLTLILGLVFILFSSQNWLARCKL